jgi:hypothetical protein
MLFVALLIGFVTVAMITSALAHDPHRWGYAASLMAVCAAILAVWSAELLSAGINYLSWPAHPSIIFVFAAAPYAAVVVNVLIRRGRTPQHTPSLEDDPVLRRYVAEKLRRARQRRQAEALEAAPDDGG